MGAEPGAHLIFGIPIEEKRFNENSIEMSDFVEKLGIDMNERLYEKKLDDLFYEHKDEWPVEICITSYYDSSGYYLILKGKEKEDDGISYPKGIDKSFFQISDEEINKMKEWCESFGLEWIEPQWFLLASIYN